MTKVEYNEMQYDCLDDINDQLERTKKALHLFEIYQIPAKDCANYAAMSIDELEQLYSYLEQAIDTARDFMQKIGILADLKKELADLVKYPEDYIDEGE